MFLPCISIITVCYNAEHFIEQSIQSVVGQSYPNIEYILVDGRSTDHTLEIIERFSPRISRIISEKDQGLYDAMNKGIAAATGDYIYFLNADDQLYDAQVISRLFSDCKAADAYYGETVMVGELGTELGLRSSITPHQLTRQLSWKSLRWGMLVSHQAFIIKRSLCVQYDVHYKICADIDWMIRCLKQCEIISFQDLIICKFRMGGKSKQHQSLAWKERFFILQKHFGFFPNLYHHLFIGFRFLFS
ncbi:MAG: glycosyltransferase family 2 protein [Chitinophagaceae bacterium]